MVSEVHTLCDCSRCELNVIDHVTHRVNRRNRAREIVIDDDSSALTELDPDCFEP